eukprot:5270581-Prymnesium_polylepis.1
MGNGQLRGGARGSCAAGGHRQHRHSHQPLRIRTYVHGGWHESRQALEVRVAGRLRAELGQTLHV